jgi:Lanthionine synthetase C-like protein
VLYDPGLHEPLTDEAWEEERVRTRIRAIVDDAVAAFDPETLWPAHEWDVFQSEPPVREVYVGAAGVVWALDALRRGGCADVPIDLSAAALRALELFRERPDYAGWAGDGWEPPPQADASLIMGESGILLVAWRTAPDPEIADALHRRVRENVDNEAIEVMWGSPGTMLAAEAMHLWTGEPRWKEAWRESADRLRATRDEDGLWTQRLYGSTHRSLTPPHGFAGIARVLRLGGEPVADAGEVARRTAVVEDGGVNWPTRADTAELAGGDGQVRLQWCGGAPGMVIALAEDLDEDLLLAGAETTWRAGPFGEEKGPGICHGTAGNGFALLKTFARTGNEVWLERARRFAVHALGQVERMPPRYSLFTGGIGTAVFAARCVEGRADYPTIDSWD